MKKYIAILILILFCQAGYSQSMDKLFNDFAKQKNVTHVTVGPVSYTHLTLPTAI